MRIVKANCVYKHFKGMKVTVILIAKDSETLEKVVVYKHLDKDEYWVRNYDMFNSEVDHDKYPDVLQKYRFEEVSEND